VVREDSTASDLVALVRSAHDAASDGDFDTMMSVYGPDAVLRTERFGRFEGRAAIRSYFEDWLGSFDDLRFELELHDHGNGIVFAGQDMTGRHASSSSEIHMQNAAVHEFVDDLIVRSTTYTDIDEARAAAERRAEERE
jgi:ketosteroid isomerase-like protein